MQRQRLTGRTGKGVPAKALTTVVSSGWAQERMLENGCMLQTQEASSATCMSPLTHDTCVNPKLEACRELYVPDPMRYDVVRK